MISRTLIKKTKTIFGKILKTNTPAILPEKPNDEQSPLFLYNTTIVNNGRQTGKIENIFRNMMEFSKNSTKDIKIIFIDNHQYQVKRHFMDWFKSNYPAWLCNRTLEGSYWIDMFNNYFDKSVRTELYFFFIR